MTTLEQQTREKGFAAAWSVASATSLTILKIGVGLWTGSLGILAEAAHSALDLAAALITFFAVRVSDRPADDTHLYGHGKVENLSALVETLLLLVTCAWIIYEAFQRLFVAHVEVDPSVWAFGVMIVSIVVNYFNANLLGRTAKKYQSQALEADALHFSTDIWSSLVVLFGLALVWLGEQIGQKEIFTRADAIAALVVALIVIYVSVQLGKRTIDALLDSAPRGLAERIISAVARVPHVRHVTRTRVRGSGTHVFVEVHVVVPRHLSLEESHAVTQRIREAVHTISPHADVVVTTTPSADNEGIFETIQSVAARNHLAVHNISTHQTDKGIWVDLDLEVAPTISFDEAHRIATDLETRVRAELSALQDAYPIADVNVHIEPRAQELVTGHDLAPKEAAQYIERLRAIAATLPHVRACREIDVQRANNQVYLACHLRLDAHLSVAEVHSLTEELENRLRREFPALGRVVIHAEPV
ncbi:MAG: cation-efflux pump [Anaerolineae bacterium]|nr:cation-efflux pump [Anaerolineae bacterium]